MSNSAGDVIDDFYQNKKKECEAKESNKTTHTLIFNKVGDVCEIKIGDLYLVGKADIVKYERDGDIESLVVELEEKIESTN